MDLSWDGWRRASFRSNEIVRRVSVEEDTGLADLEKAFMDIAFHGLLGREQFVDGCHWWGDYYLLVAKVIIKEMVRNNKIDFQIRQSNRYKSLLSFYNFLPLIERSRNRDDVNWVTDVAIWNVITIDWEDEYNLEAISCFKTLYLMDSDKLWNMQFLKEKFRKVFLNRTWAGEFISNNYSFKERWLLVIYHVGETYRQLKLYKEALEYFNKAITLGGDNYLPYLGRALVYHALGDKQKARENIDKAKENSNRNSLEFQWYEEILEL